MLSLRKALKTKRKYFEKEKYTKERLGVKLFSSLFIRKFQLGLFREEAKFLSFVVLCFISLTFQT